MPRLQPSTLRKAWTLHPHLWRLLPTCRDISSAQNELRWITEHASQARKGQQYIDTCVRRRAAGEPLQYILGSEFFGELELACEPGVLIPRQETALSTSHLVDRLNLADFSKSARNGTREIRVLDLCSGSGCIPLLFHNQFYLKPEATNIPLHIVGVDISSKAINLARRNQAQTLSTLEQGRPGLEQLRSLQRTSFIKGDIFDKAFAQRVTEISSDARLAPLGSRPLDVLISNPPYISSKAFWQSTARSVRRFEPRLALVPPKVAQAVSPHDGDSFYAQLIDVAQQADAGVCLFEVADFEQACRVASMIVNASRWEHIEIWRDNPAASSSELDQVHIRGHPVRIYGSGHGRSVVAHTRNAAVTLH